MPKVARLVLCLHQILRCAPCLGLHRMPAIGLDFQSDMVTMDIVEGNCACLTHNVLHERCFVKVLGASEIYVDEDTKLGAFISSDGSNSAVKQFDELFSETIAVHPVTEQHYVASTKKKDRDLLIEVRSHDMSSTQSPRGANAI